MVREEAEKGTTRVGKYELGRTLGEGNFGKVKHAKHIETGKAFAIKILDRKRILKLKIADQIKREIGTLKLLRHPNVVRLHEIFKGETKIPKWLSPGAQNLIRRILDPNPKNRINIAGIRADDWFNQQYTPTAPDDGEDISIENKLFSIKETHDDKQKLPTLNAFELIGMSLYLDLSGFFEKEDISERRIQFTSSYSPSDMFERIEGIVTKMGFQCQKGHSKLKVMQLNNDLTIPMCPRSIGSLLVVAEVFELSPSLYVVELRKSYGDSSLYKEMCRKISEDLGVCK